MYAKLREVIAYRLAEIEADSKTMSIYRQLDGIKNWEKWSKSASLFL